MWILLGLFAIVAILSASATLIRQRNQRGVGTESSRIVCFPATRYELSGAELICKAADGSELRIHTSEIVFYASTGQGDSRDEYAVHLRNNTAIFLPDYEGDPLYELLNHVAPDKNISTE